MTQFIDIKPGQWVLAFDQPYGPYDRTMAEQVELFASRHGGWEGSPELCHRILVEKRRAA